ncbi:hypothetical protein KPH14_010618 [Odynerus spinipes]|uniref:Uncharacterized protein n=1 Tax=Odynerus spinipes TaxID=1348599 RepID=A0AAD9RVA0_9HYME|nr:hypothetical protein KPH14_010618 [Odynerus spinipes]
MLKGSLPPYLDTHNEEDSFYVTLSNGPHAYVAESTNTEPENYNHNLEDVYFVTPILCKHCEDYIWGSGKVGVACNGKQQFYFMKNLLNKTKKKNRRIEFRSCQCPSIFEWKFKIMNITKKKR